MATQEPSVQRSFRLSRQTVDLLDAMARTTGTSRNALADRLLNEAIRAETHPMVRFQTGAAGRRRPLLVGTRLYIYQVIATLRGHDGDVDVTADYFNIHPRQVRAALSYYADFTDEVDADEAHAHEVERVERARWEREQQALG